MQKYLPFLVTFFLIALFVVVFIAWRVFTSLTYKKTY